MPPNGLQLLNLQPEHFEALQQLQIDCYPTLDPRELMRIEHFEAQLTRFPQGQFVAILPDQPGLRNAPLTTQGRLVGQASGFFIDFDFNNPGHTFLQIVDNNRFGNHDPQGSYYYDADVSTHPDARGRGIGTALYNARKTLVRQHHKKGIVGGGLIPGYARHKHTLSPHDYVRSVIDGQRTDPTLSFHLRNGFRVRGLLRDYLIDDASDNWATLIEWTNDPKT
ncbi:GNAT family N-acetyltransferase [Mucisphaera calidilacus]|uniref:Acetyltransferase (GNAT) family protein n=1 Tax=Mucisphaera calidilacus TaxID=2527982 RepID=A0A518C167_9BACT|nr:GNAT family N-acetyltransferase [Mucisphaera calidilacus]QDU72976.1 Acetyltransferase (GNAT) family protein [Mucisphaera calidilacus]